MLPRTGDVAQPSDSGRKEKRKPIRRDPEKRRQQNVQAQKKYREKLRERLDRLEELEASAGQRNAAEIAPAAAAAGLPDIRLVHDSPSISSHVISESPPAFEDSNTSISNSAIASPGKCQHSNKLSDQCPLEFNMWDSLIHSSHPEGIPSPSSIWDLTTPANSTWDSTSSTMVVWDSTTPMHTSLFTRDQQKHHDHLDPFWTTTIHCGCSIPHVQVQTQGPDPLTFGAIRVLKWEPNAPNADPYANALRIETVCTTAALYHLGMHIGMTEEILCDDDSLSPFFRFSADSTDELTQTNMIRTVQDIFKSLKPDLRPTSEQITIKHHPYIDLLPFPTLRNNLIARQGEIDEDEFFHDLLTGLVCWGGAGIGRKDRNLSTGYASTGTPWDVRSWEAKVWFLKKYWSLLGGEDGELVRQSEWWRSIRGDDTLETEAHSQR